MEQKVLVLNQDFRAIALCSVQKAFVLIYLQKAELISKSENAFIHTISKAYPSPSVIRLQRYINVPYRGISLSRHNILKRDNFMCQYCGSKRNLTIDHVIPRSKGGASDWKNLVAACLRCNNRKGDKTPDQAGLKLIQQPKRPSLNYFLALQSGTLSADWSVYLQHEK